MLVLANPIIFLLASRSVVFKLSIFSPKEINGGTERVRRNRPLKHNFQILAQKYTRVLRLSTSICISFC